jgi:hypothetical protein
MVIGTQKVWICTAHGANQYLPIPHRTAGRRAVITRWFRDFGTPADPRSANMQWPGLNIYAYSPERRMRAHAALRARTGGQAGSTS